MPPPTLSGDVVGLDIGGTKTHGVRWHGDSIIAEARTGSANVQNVSAETAAANLHDLFIQLGMTAVGRVIAGAGGIDTDDDADALRRLIGVQVPGTQVTVVHDTRLILAAGHVSMGVAVIVGTGSVAWGMDDDGRQARSGGWGHLLGDEGSAYWLAREAIRDTLRFHEQGQEPGELGRRLLSYNRVDSPEQLIALFHGGTGRDYWAGQAHLVFDAHIAGDQSSGRIIETAAAHVAGLIRSVSARLNMSGPIIVGGGLATKQPIFRDKLRSRLHTDGLRDLQFLEQDPVMGVQYLLNSI